MLLVLHNSYLLHSSLNLPSAPEKLVGRKPCLSDHIIKTKPLFLNFSSFTRIPQNPAQKMTNPLKFFVALMLFSIPILHVRSENYVQEACSVTLYQDVCIRSLASYSHKLKRSPRRWARVGVSVAIREVKLVFQHLTILTRYGHIRGKRTRAALSDCVECIQDTLDNLHRALQVLRRLSFSAFNEQMNDVLTWLSAALTDEDTCIDGFEGRRKSGRIARFCGQVQNATYITSNALALANKLATTGLHDSGDDHHDDQHHP